MPSKQILDFYATPGPMTKADEYAEILKSLPDNIKELTRIVQGICIHQYMAPAYGVELSSERTEESHIRSLVSMFDTIIRDGQPLATRREPAERLVGVCHHFAVMLVGLLRAKGVPARMRFGFGNYFIPNFYEDHSLCEYWNADEKRWILVDPQFDDTWQQETGVKHDVFDVPRDEFVVAGDAWQKSRKGEIDASKVGTFNGQLRGLWFIAGVIVRDIAALNKVEVLQWDSWGTMPKPGERLEDNQELLTMFDGLAEYSHDPDKAFDAFRKLYQEDDQLQVPKQVFNALRGRPEILDSVPTT